MKTSSAQFDRLFTVEQANATLPLVRAIVSDLTRLYRDLVERQQRLEHLSSTNSKKDAGDPYGDELRQMQSDLEQDKLQLREYVDELRQLGVECKDPGRGLIDFPAEIDGRVVYLCWKLGDPEVLFYHELDAGFAGRQPLTADSVAEGGESEFDPSESV